MKITIKSLICVVLLSVLILPGCAGPRASKMKNSDKAMLYHDTGIGYLQKGEPENAIDALKKCLQYDPDNAPAMHLLGLAYFQMDILDSAEAWMLKAKSRDPNNSDLLNNLAGLYLKQKRYQETIDLVTKVLEDPNYYTPAAAYFNRGVAHFNLSSFNKAGEDFKRAIKHEPFFDRAHMMLGKVYLEEGNYDLAIKYLSNSIKVNPDNMEAYYVRGIAYWNRGYVTEAEADFSIIIRKARAGSTIVESAKNWLEKIR